MFDLGFSEILFIAIIALLFIGPDKLPETLKSIAKTIGKIKRGLDDVKESVNQELKVDELREEVLSYKRELDKAKEDLSAFKNVASKEISQIRQSVDVRNEFQPKSLNDDKDFLKEWEEAQKEFDEFEKVTQKDDKGKSQQAPDLAKEVTEHLSMKSEKSVEFKNLRREVN